MTPAFASWNEFFAMGRRNAVEFLCQKGISVRATGRNEAMGKLLEKMGAEFVY